MNHRLPSSPAVMSMGMLLLWAVGYSVIVPMVVMRPILPMAYSANQRLPSGPDVSRSGQLSCVFTLNSVISPVGVMRPMALSEHCRMPVSLCSVNPGRFRRRSHPSSGWGIP